MKKRKGILAKIKKISRIPILFGVVVYLSCFVCANVLAPAECATMELIDLNDFDEKETEKFENEEEIDDHLVESIHSLSLAYSNTILVEFDNCRYLDYSQEVATPPPEFI